LSERKLKEVGTVIHYFSNIGVAIVELSDTLSVGDHVLTKGMTTNVEQTVDSMQIEHATVEKAGVGASVGIKVAQKVRQHDKVYKVTE